MEGDLTLRRDKRQSGKSWPSLAALAGVLAAIVGSSCGGHPPKVTEALPEGLEEPAPEPSRSVEVHFYLDATQSMQGFLYQPAGRTNYFRTLLDHIGGILFDTWADHPQVHYWGFGRNEPWKIEIRDYLEPKAFNGTKTFIDQAIMHTPPANAGQQTSLPRLKIIVTDLFQEGNNMDKLAVNLSDTLNDPAQAVGVVGIRNPFDGPIDDLPGGQTLHKGAAESLPFYLLVIGPIGDVTRCVAELSRGLKVDGLPQDQAISMVFGRRLLSGAQQRLHIPELDKSGKPKPGNQDGHDKSEPNILNGNDKSNPKLRGFSPADNRVPNAKRLGIPYLADVRRDLVLQIDAGCKDGALKQIGSNLRASSPASLKLFGWQADSKGQKGYWKESRDKAAAISPDLAIDPGGCVTGKLALDRSILDKNAVYMVQIELIGERTDFGSLSDWYVELKDIPAIVKNDSYSQKTGKTPNLRFLLETLSGAMFKSSRIPLARYYFYVETR
jgi:hypothetical protein